MGGFVHACFELRKLLRHILIEGIPNFTQQKPTRLFIIFIGGIAVTNLKAARNLITLSPAEVAVCSIIQSEMLNLSGASHGCTNK